MGNLAGIVRHVWRRTNQRPENLGKIGVFVRNLEAQKSIAVGVDIPSFENPSGHGRPLRKSWTSAPKGAFFCGPADGEKLFDPRASGRKGQECPQEIRTEKLMSMLFFFQDFQFLKD